MLILYAFSVSLSLSLYAISIYLAMWSPVFRVGEINPLHATDPYALFGRGKLATKLGQFLHITYHRFPAGKNHIQACVVALLWCVWLRKTPRAMKLRCIFSAVAYSFLEYNFTKGFTTFAQVWMNILYGPVLLDGYYKVASIYTYIFVINVFTVSSISCILYMYGMNDMIAIRTVACQVYSLLSFECLATGDHWRVCFAMDLWPERGLVIIYISLYIHTYPHTHTYTHARTYTYIHI